MKNRTTSIIAVLALAVTLGISTPAMARGNYGHHGGGHHGYGYRGHHYGNGHRYYGGQHKYGYLAAGLVLGAAISNYRYQPRFVQRRTVVYRRPVYAQPTVYTQPVSQAPQATPAPVERPDYFLRKDRNGECWLVESTEDGEQIITPQSPDVCG